jgi:hypothetical protein
VYRSSETSINQLDVIIRSDDRLLSLVVDSDSIVSKIYMLNFGCFFFSVSILTKILQFYPSWGFFCPHTDKHLAILSKCTFDTQSIHIFGLFLEIEKGRHQNVPLNGSYDDVQLINRCFRWSVHHYLWHNKWRWDYPAFESWLFSCHLGQ